MNLATTDVIKGSIFLDFFVDGSFGTSLPLFQICSNETVAWFGARVGAISRLLVEFNFKFLADNHYTE